MAFDAYRRQERGTSLAKRVVFVLVAVAHGAVIAAGVVYSYWHVDELTPPTLRVTFISAAPPPPPPPPPPAGGGSKPKKVAIKTVTPVVVPKPTDIVQPREKVTPVVKKEFRKHDDEEEEEEDDGPKGVKGGVKGGVIGGIAGGEVGGELGGTKGGVIGGTPGGSGTAPVAAKFLPPNMGALQKESGSDPDFPPALRRSGMEYIVQAKICVSRTGSVESVAILNKADPLLEDSVKRTVTKTWRYRPLLANSMAVPFCYFGRFEFKSQ